MYNNMHASGNVKSVQFFFASYFAKFHVEISGWAERFKQLHRHYLILHLDQIPLKFPTSFFL